MNNLFNTVRALFSSTRSGKPTVRKIRNFHSPNLGRGVDLDIYLPQGYRVNGTQRFPLVIFNDGQDLPRADFVNTLTWMWKKEVVPPFIVVGIYCGPERDREYGTARQMDYKRRGDKASQYSRFVLEELLPYLREHYRFTNEPATTAIAGFSLGGLSAMDIGWQFPEVFGSVGAFSGSFWWRSKAIDPKDPDANRIMQNIIHQWPGPADAQRFWFQTGTDDEQEDRNKNGVIDSIDDTLDVIHELKAKGYSDAAVRYLEIEGGEHDAETWGQAMPDFLDWWLN